MEGQISAKMILDSIDPRGNRLRTLEVVMPRYILAEFNTHRMLSKNSASSRAIPFKKMVKSVLENPFIPYAWMEDHKGMQGTKYLSKTDKFSLVKFIGILMDTLNTYDKNSKEYENLSNELEEKVELINTILIQYKYDIRTLDEWWLLARDKAVECASIMYVFRVTKQLANRLLEPFMYHKVLVSGTEWDNFFNLRCPKYEFLGNIYKNRREAIKNNPYPSHRDFTLENWGMLEWLKVNKGQADIHMMFLAEAIWDATNESTPKKLKEGEWHTPYGDQMDFTQLVVLGIDKGLLEQKENIDDYYNQDDEDVVDELRSKISIARCARLSYQTLGDNPVIDYEKDLELYESLYNSKHASPAEHIARVMTNEEYDTFIKQEGNIIQKGWSRNYKGFRQWREITNL